jgi:hypothetical protein
MGFFMNTFEDGAIGQGSNGVRVPSGICPGMSSLHPDPEVVPRAKRRRLSIVYKRRIINEVDACIVSAGGTAAMGLIVGQWAQVALSEGRWRRRKKVSAPCQRV